MASIKDPKHDPTKVQEPCPRCKQRGLHWDIASIIPDAHRWIHYGDCWFFPIFHLRSENGSAELFLVQLTLWNNQPLRSDKLVGSC